MSECKISFLYYFLLKKLDIGEFSNSYILEFLKKDYLIGMYKKLILMVVTN